MKACGFEWTTRDSFPEELVNGLRIEDEGRQREQGGLPPIEEQQTENSSCISEIEQC